MSTNGRPKPSSTPKRDPPRESNSNAHHQPSSSSSPSGNHAHVHAPSTSEPREPDQSPRPQPGNGLSVNTVGGSLATPDIYLTPSAGSSGERTQPIIVLQEAPITVNHSDTPPAPARALMNARTRHEKILQRQMSDHELSPFILTHQQLEAIVIHDAPIVSRPSRPQAASVEEEDPAFAPLPKT